MNRKLYLYECEFCGKKQHVHLYENIDNICRECNNCMNIYMPNEFEKNQIHIDRYAKKILKKEYMKISDIYIIKDFGIVNIWCVYESDNLNKPFNAYIPWCSIKKIEYNGEKLVIIYEMQTEIICDYGDAGIDISYDTTEEKIIYKQDEIRDINFDEFYKLIMEIYNEYKEKTREYVKRVDENYNHDLRKYKVPTNEKEYFNFEYGVAKKYKENPSSYKVYVINDEFYIFNGIKNLPKYKPNDTERCNIINVKDIVEIKIIGNVQDKIKISGGGGEVGGTSIGGAIVGDMLFGPVGAIIGSRKKGKIEEVSSEYYRDDNRDIQIKLRDGRTLILPYFSNYTHKYNNQSEQFDNFYDFLKIRLPNLFKENNEKNENSKKSESSKNKENSKNNDYINELKDLKQLLDAGIINQEEFEKKKQQILGI